jgi:cytochrome c
MRRRLGVLAASWLIAGMSTAALGADLENGEAVYKKCRACHLIGDGARNTVGPQLNGIVGRKAGSADKYAYSDNMLELAKGGLVWTDDTLDKYLTNPKDLVPNGKMAFPGLPDKPDRDDLIAYLRKFP